MKRKSRLTRKEEARSIRRAFFYGGLTLVLALAMVFLGIPALIRMAIFLADLRSSSQPVENTDTLPPSPPILGSAPPATNSSQMNLQGFSEPGASIKVFLTGAVEKEVVADNDGSFSVSDLRLTLGKNEIFAVAIDEANNTSQESERLVIYYDDTPPELEVTAPTDGESFLAEQNKVEIRGKTEEGSAVYINDHLVVVGREGSFQYPITLQKGENSIIIVARDQAGNETTEERVVNYSL